MHVDRVLAPAAEARRPRRAGDHGGGWSAEHGAAPTGSGRAAGRGWSPGCRGRLSPGSATGVEPGDPGRGPGQPRARQPTDAVPVPAGVSGEHRRIDPEHPGVAGELLGQVPVRRHARRPTACRIRSTTSRVRRAVGRTVAAPVTAGLVSTRHQRRGRAARRRARSPAASRVARRRAGCRPAGGSPPFTVRAGPKLRRQVGVHRAQQRRRPARAGSSRCRWRCCRPRR